MKIRVITTGGTIDKTYYDALSDYKIGEPAINDIFHTGRVEIEWVVESILHKDSLEITEEDRALIRKACERSEEAHILITHGTDTMSETAQVLSDLSGTPKTIVLTGAFSPALFRDSDAPFNAGLALGALQCLPSGVYIAMNGRIFPADNVTKNRAAGKFEKSN